MWLLADNDCGQNAAHRLDGTAQMCYALYVPSERRLPPLDGGCYHI